MNIRGQGDARTWGKDDKTIRDGHGIGRSQEISETMIE